MFVTRTVLALRIAAARLLTVLRVLMLTACVLGAACGSPVGRQPAVEFTTVPVADAGGSAKMAPIAGRVTGARPDQQIVLFAKSGVWWVQPLTVQPFTAHRGRRFLEEHDSSRDRVRGAARRGRLSVPRRPPTRYLKPGGPVLAVATVKGTGDFVQRTRQTLTFSGYEWELRAIPSDRGGANDYDPGNAWTDASGFLHLKLAQRAGVWTSAEVILTRSLGYGTYIVRRARHVRASIRPRRWDCSPGTTRAPTRIIASSTSRSANGATAAIANAQYVVQPYYVPANVVRFAAPAGRLTHSFRWEPGRASFRTVARHGLRPLPAASSPSTSSRPACRSRAPSACA